MFAFASLTVVTTAVLLASVPVILVTGEPAITTGCEPGNTYKYRAEFTWPTGVTKPSGLTYRSFRCVIQDTTTLDAFTVSNNASVPLKYFVGGLSSTLTSANTAGIEYTSSLFFSSSLASSSPAERVSFNNTATFKASIGTPVLKCFGGVTPSPDWFFGVSVDICSQASTMVAYDVKLYDLGTMNGSTFATSMITTNPTGTVQPVSAYPQTFGKLYVTKTSANTQCRQAGQYFAWAHSGLWPSTVTKPSGAKFTGMICAMHSTNYSMWQPNQLASSAMKSLAETGSTTAMEATLAGNSNVMFYRKFTDFEAGQTARYETNLPANMPNYPVYSCACKVSPSPDWFVGVDSQPLCGDYHTHVYLAQLHDAGTNDGADWSSNITRSSPHTINMTWRAYSGVYMTQAATMAGSAAASFLGVAAAVVATLSLL